MQIYVIKFLAFYIGCMTCATLQTEVGLNPVLSSALVGFLGTFFKFPKANIHGIHSAIYAGSFAGMCSVEILQGPQHIIGVSVLGSILYVWAQPHFSGYGGRLGTIAFISSTFIFLSKSLW